MLNYNQSPASTAFVDYYRCPDQFAAFDTHGALSSDEGYFTFRGAICYGRRRGAALSQCDLANLPDASPDVEMMADGRVRLPFHFSEIVTNLRQERYHQSSQNGLADVTSTSASRKLYYFVRPILPVAVRKHLQRARLRGWDKIAFPRWPVDATVDTLMQSAIELTLKCGGPRKIPFIWFWPDGAPSAAIVTHDVEAPAGLLFCAELMDMDDSSGIKSSFQIVPEVRYKTSKSIFDGMRSRGFEGNIHDLNHDGRLFHSRQQFQQRVTRINQYAKEFESRGFRAGAMYREQGWFDLLEMSFDMSVPSVSHLEPQRGGCCTVMPYAVGHVLELPLTTIQDYSLFHILGDYSIELWKKQIDLIRAKNGLITILTHPDYLIEKRARAVYMDLLAHLGRLRDEGKVWIALPGDVERWWRSRQGMALVRSDGDSWRVEGPGRERARVAYATLKNDRVVYELDGAS